MIPEAIPEQTHDFRGLHVMPPVPFPFYCTVTEQVSPGESVTIPEPVGFTVTLYVLGAAEGLMVDPPPPPPQETAKKIAETARAARRTAVARLRLVVNGTPRSTAQKTNAPPLFHGGVGT